MLDHVAETCLCVSTRQQTAVSTVGDGVPDRLHPRCHQLSEDTTSVCIQDNLKEPSASSRLRHYQSLDAAEEVRPQNQEVGAIGGDAML